MKETRLLSGVKKNVNKFLIGTCRRLEVLITVTAPRLIHGSQNIARVVAPMHVPLMVDETRQAVFRSHGLPCHIRSNVQFLTKEDIGVNFVRKIAIRAKSFERDNKDLRNCVKRQGF